MKYFFIHFAHLQKEDDSQYLMGISFSTSEYDARNWVLKNDLNKWFLKGYAIEFFDIMPVSKFIFERVSKKENTWN